MDYIEQKQDLRDYITEKVRKKTVANLANMLYKHKTAFAKSPYKKVRKKPIKRRKRR